MALGISVFGLGFVGTVTTACLAHLGHHVIGVDSNPAKVKLLARGEAPIIEPEVQSLVESAHREGHISATTDVGVAVKESDLSLVCVGTPSDEHGLQDTSSIMAVCNQIANEARMKPSYHSIVIRSTVLPGTLRQQVLPELEQGIGGRVGIRFGLASNPEFMREGSGVSDFFAASRIVIGAFDVQTAEALVRIYSGLSSRIFRVKPELAESIKYVDNVWHALKVVFANEVAAVSDACGVDPATLMDLFEADEQLNISRAYLKPGFAFGGPCLPKDCKTFVAHAEKQGISVPMMSGLITSNQQTTDQLAERLIKTGMRRFAMFGLAYKMGTYDLRGSPYVALGKRLSEAGCTVRVFDPEIEKARLIEANFEYTDKVVPNLGELLVSDVNDLIHWAQVLILTSASRRELVTELRADQTVVSLFPCLLDNI